MFAYRLPHQTDDCRLDAADRLAPLAAACATMAAERGDVTSTIVLLGCGPADALLAPERLAALEGHFHVYLEVLDRGDAATPACIRVTRPPEAGPTARRLAVGARRVLTRLLSPARRLPGG